MQDRVITRDPTAVELEVQSAYLSMFPEGDRVFVPRVFGWFIECFTGHYADYQAVDAHYHDLEHTLQGTLCMARLLAARHQARAKPRLTPHVFELGILAILLHDTGYLKKRNDTEGTGAKYTVTHVERSAQFAEELLSEKGFPQADILAVQNMIFCTGVNTSLESIPFQSELERITGYALGTADLLGQMSADDYVDKLPVLYEEFAEAARFERGDSSFIKAFTSAADLMRRTPAFWSSFVLPKLKNDFMALYQFLSEPYPAGPNYYLERVQANMDLLKRRL